MLALLSDAPGRPYLTEVPRPRAGQGEVVVRIEEVGICGTDLKIVAGSLAATRPIVLGHELVGHVASVGPGATAPVGQRVMVIPATWCGHCRYCRAGRSNLCQTAGRMGIDIPGGALAELAVPQDRLIPLRDSTPPSTAVLLQVLGTCVHAQRLVNLFPGQRAAVVGLGVSGLMHVQLLKARGVDVVAVGRSPAKLDLARQMGASEAIDTGTAASRVADGLGFDVVVEAAGTAESFALSGELANPGGTLLVFGIHDGQDRAVPFGDFYLKELAVVNARGATALDYENTVLLAASGAVDLSAIRISRHPLTDAAEAFDAAGRTKETVKFVLQP